MSKHWIVGYGSLLDEPDLRRTAPRAVNLQPVIVNDYARRFDLVVPNRRGCGEPIAVLNVRPQPGAHFNGLLFAVDDEGLEALNQREYCYERQRVRGVLWGDGVTPFEAETYVAEPSTALIYNPADAAQRGYTETCFKGARSFGAAFVDMFLDTTWTAHGMMRDVDPAC